MTIASVVQGLIETEGGKVFELDSPKGSTWVESVSSFRYVPTGANKPYTVRQETKKGGDYWYGYRKMAGRLHKKYIGKSSELSTAKLEEIAEALNTHQQPTVTQVTDTVTQVTEANNQRVTGAVTDRYTAERVTALELQVQALQEPLEDLRSELRGKLELGNFSELPNPYEVTDSELQTELSNLKAELSNLATENEKLRADYAALLESSVAVTNKLREEVQELRSQLETERANQEEEIEAEREDLAQLKKQTKEHALEVHREGRAIEAEKDRWQGELSEARADLAAAKATINQLKGKIVELERGYTLKPNPAERRLRLEIGELQSELADLKQKSATTSSELPEAADLYNRLKARRKKSGSSLADVELILEMIEKS